MRVRSVWGIFLRHHCILYKGQGQPAVGAEEGHGGGKKVPGEGEVEGGCQGARAYHAQARRRPQHLHFGHH